MTAHDAPRCPLCPLFLRQPARRLDRGPVASVPRDALPARAGPSWRPTPIAPFPAPRSSGRASSRFCRCAGRTIRHGVVRGAGPHQPRSGGCGRSLQAPALRRCAIITLAEGEISELHVGLKGTMNALFLKDLAIKTHRGIRGRVEAGKIGGGNAYGYRVVQQLDARGEPIRGDREIDRGAGRDRSPHLSRICRRQGAEAHRRRLEPRSYSRPNRQALVGHHHPR